MGEVSLFWQGYIKTIDLAFPPMFYRRQTAGARVKVLKNCMRFSKDGSNACSPLICWVNAMSRLQRSDVPPVLELGGPH